jgi:hypothetical protein
VETVLGVSVTSNSVGWVLLDGPGVDAATLDHVVFDVSVGSVDDGAISECVKTVERMKAIAATSGHELKSIGLTWTADAAATANLLLTSLPDLGFEKKISVPLSEAASTWAQVFGAALGFERAAVCVLEPAAATLLSFGEGGVRTFATHVRQSDDGLSRWLKDAFEINHVDPEHLFLIGPRSDVELISGRLSEALEISVVTSKEAQLILARGTALMVRTSAEAVAVPLSGEHPATLKVNAAALAALAGVIALFMLGPMLRSQLVSPSTREQPASTSWETSVSRQAVPASPAPPPSKEAVDQMVQPASAPPPPTAPSPPVDGATAPESQVQPLAVPEAPAAAVPPEVPAMDAPEVPAMGVPEAPAAEAPAEGALLPAPAEVPNLPAQTADAPAEVPHLPAEGTSHLPGSAPVLAAEAPIAEGAPASTTPTQAGSIPVLGALP